MVVKCTLVHRKLIPELGTHFVDMSRYFGGEVDLSTVVAHSLEWDEPAGALSKMNIDESKIAPENRIPRVTSATWYVVSDREELYSDSYLGNTRTVLLAAFATLLLSREPTTAVS